MAESGRVFIKLSSEITPTKLKQFKFLLQDVTDNAVLKDKNFLEVITELENRSILQRTPLRPKDGELLCEICDALSLTKYTSEILQRFGIERDPNYQSVITPYRKLLVIFSNNLNESRSLERMTSFLKREGHDILQDCPIDDALEIFQAMEQARLMSLDNLFLLKKMLNSLSRPDLVEKIEEISTYHKAYGLRYLPADMIQRQPELDAVLNLLNSGKDKVAVVGVRSGDVIGIRGMGGIGKTVLAQCVAWNMCSSRKVIWLDIGQTPDCLALVNTLVKALGGTRSFSELHVAQSWIRKNTEKKDYLIVLDDVWNVNDARVFDVLAGDCQLLITTRDADVVHGLQGSTIYELGTMGKEEARNLLYKSAQVQLEHQLFKFGEKFTRVVEGLLEECRGLALALALVGSSLIDARNVEGWQDVLDDLKNADLKSVRSCFSKDAYPYEHLLAAIEVSFQRLQKIYQDKFLDFAIFPEDTDIPSSVLETYWASDYPRSSPLSPRETRRILNVLEKRSLIQKSPSDDGKNAYRVHDLLLDFTRAKLRQMGQPISDVQGHFLEMFRKQCKDRDWSGFPENNEYFFTYLPYHLRWAEEFADLLRLFFDFEWLQRKVKVTSLASLISDFRFLDWDSGDCDSVKILKSSLMLSADVLDNRSVEMGAQLLGRLHSCSETNPSVKKLLDQIQGNLSKKRLLLPLHSILTEPDGPLIQIFKRHKGTVFSLRTAYRVSGTIVISASSDHLIKVNELETGKELKVLKGHKMNVCCLALSHGLTILASGSYDTTVKIWNLDSYVEMRTLECGGGYVNAVEFSADDKRLYTGSNDGSLKAWNVSTGDQLDSIQAHKSHIRGLCATVAGNLVATASLDHNIKLWSTAETFKLVTTLEGHTDAVYAVVSTSTVLVSASGDRTVKIWDLTTYQELHSLSDGDRQEAVYSVAVTQDGQRIISGGHDSVVRLWCLTTGELLFCFKGHSQAIRFVMATTDGTKALSGSQDTTFRVWNLNVSNLRQSVSSGHNKDVTDISVNNNGSLGASSSLDGTVKIWHCETAQEIHILKGHTRRVVSLSMSTDGTYVVSAAKDSFVKVWDVKDGKMLASVEMHQPRLVRFNETHELVLVGCEDNQLFIWNWRNTEIPYRSVPLPAFTTMEMVIDHDIVCTCSFGAEICQVDLANNNVSMLCQGPTTGYKSVMILPNEKAVLLSIPTSNHLIFWEMSSSREIDYSTGFPSDAHVTAMDITNDEKRVLCGSSTGTLSQINLKPPEIIQKYENTRLGKSIRFVAVLKNDRHFVFVDETNTVELRSLDDKEKVILGQPASEVTSVCPVGLQFLLVGCKDGEFVCFYLVGACGRHKGHDCAVTRLASCIKNGHFLYFISGSENGSVKCWYLTTDSIPCQWFNLWILNDVHSYPVTALAYIPGSEDVVSGSYDNVVKRINANGIVKEFPFQCYDVPALCVVGDSMFATYVRSLSVVDWSLGNVRAFKRLHGGAGREQVARIFLPTGRVVSKGSNHSLVYWDRNSGNIIRTLHGHTNHIRALALVPGGEFLLSGSRDNVLKLWSLETGELVDEFHFERFVLAICCAPNGIVCVGLQGGQVCFMRVNNLTRPPS